MPHYINQTDVFTAYGQNRFALLADNDDDNLTDSNSADAAIDAAEAEVVSYVGHRYSLPLPGIVSEADPSLNTVPPALHFRCVDIAVYRMAKDHDQLTTERKNRYKAAVDWLKLLAAGEVSMGLAEVPPSRNGSVVRVGPARTHQLGQTDGLL